MLPAPLATNQVQAPKYGKPNAKIAVPMRKTAAPTRLNFMNRTIQIFAFCCPVRFTVGLIIWKFLIVLVVVAVPLDKK